MKVIIAPDKFKGSLTSFEVCSAIADGIKQADSNIEVQCFPMADGGDGFASVMQYYLQTKTVDCIAIDPLGRKIQAIYQWQNEIKTAIIEMASASGLVLVKPNERNPLKTSSYGTGMLIKHAIDSGARKIVLGLGGSATNDAGMGILEALGFQFEDKEGRLLKASGEDLLLIDKIITPHTIAAVQFEIACDVQNVLYGADGSAYIYAPQKGASAEDVKLLDSGLRHFAEVLKKNTGIDVADVPGTGAAGGIAAGLMPFFNVQLKSGIEMVIDASGIKNKIADAGLLITGEGKIDKQTQEGKVVSRLALLAEQHNIPAIAFCGISEANDSIIKELKLQSVISLSSGTVNVSEALKNAKQILIQKTKDYFQG